MHRNKSSGQATLRFKNTEVFIKENHYLSIEHVTLSVQIATDGGVDLYPEFVSKRTGKRPPKLTTLPNVHYQWPPKGSYCLEQLLETIKHLPNCFSIFSHSNFAIYVLDDYTVDTMPEERHLGIKDMFCLLLAEVLQNSFKSLTHICTSN